MQPKPSILAVDDDATARTFLSQALPSALPVELHLASSCHEFGEMMGTVEPSLCLIDVELPDGDGFALAEMLRRKSAAPIVFLTAHADEARRLRGLELGAVEYLAKPIHPRELTLRIRNLLAKIAHPLGNQTVIPPPQPPSVRIRRFGRWRLDLMRRCLIDTEGRDHSLTASEFEVLALLTAKPHVVVTRQDIARHLGPQSAARHNARIVDILVWRLRKKLRDPSQKGDAIATVPSRGYMLVEDVASE